MLHHEKKIQARAFKSVAAIAILLIFIIGCRKSGLEKADSNGKVTRTGTAVPVTISLEEIYAQLPQTIMYNLANDIQIDLTLAEWRYESDHVIVRIPLNQAANQSFIYAVKTYANPTNRPRVFLVQFLRTQEVQKLIFRASKCG